MRKIWDFLSQLAQGDLDRYPGLWKINKPSTDLPDATLWAGYSLFHDDLAETRSLNWRKL